MNIFKGCGSLTIYNVIFSIIISYFLGCIQTSFFLGKLFKNIDIRNHGSNNAGASNAVTVMGWKYGIVTALIDILKASASVWIVSLLFPGIISLMYISGTFAILGHIFPFFLKFKGGKGAASLIGIAVAIDFKLGLVLVLAIVLTTIITDYIALGTLAMYTIFFIYTVSYKLNKVCICAALLLALVGYIKHLDNINRILRCEEIGLRKVIKKNSR